MPDPIAPIEPVAVDAAAELAVLKAAHQEVLTKRQKDKARIAELESAMTENQTKLTEANESLHRVTIGGPLQAMAESISTTPELWLEQFQKLHRVAMVNGNLTIQSSDGKPMSVPFERQAIVEYLTSDAHPQSRTFNAISILSRASGADLGRSQGPKREASPTLQFGLR